MTVRTRHDRSFGEMLQPERTALAWERTAIAMMVAGVIFVRFATTQVHAAIGAIGVVQTLLGAGLLVWAGVNYDDLGHQLRDDTALARTAAARVLGIATLAFIGVSLVLAIVIALR